MRLLISGATTSLERFAADPAVSAHVGHLWTPATSNCLRRVCSTGLPWAADNAAFGTQWNTEAFEKAALFKIPAAPSTPLFLTVPDVVGDSRATLALFRVWHRRLSVTGLPLALVLQDGVENQLLPWELFSWAFVGGSRRYASGVWGWGRFTEWKESRAAADVIRETQRRGKRVHVGRVNGLRRLRHFYNLRVDTADGSSLSLYPDTLIPQFVTALREWEGERGRAATSTGAAGCAQVDREAVHDP
jgi:hypothetical protein